MLSRSSIRAAAKSFWLAAGGRSRFGEPVDIEAATLRSLPVALHRVHDLNTISASELLQRFAIYSAPRHDVRPLRGFLAADGGVALVIIDASDTLAEQRVTLAHEVAHFLLHYDAPRRRAQAAFGPDISIVLDRTRPASRSELFSSAIRGLPIGPFQHAMARGAMGLSGEVAAMETEADELALELLAPNEVVRSMSPADEEAIAARFLLPLHAARRLVMYGRDAATSIGVESLFGIT